MENTKPIKRHAALVELSKDHHFGLLLIWKIRQGLRLGISVDRISAYCVYFFKEDLQSHFREEERYLFNLFPEDELSKKAQSDHDNLRNIIRNLDSMEATEEVLNNFADLLEKHIRFEERELFNYYQAQLTEDQLNVLLNIPWRAHTDPDAKWDDKFWEKRVEK